MKRNNFGKIGIIIAVSTTVLHYYFEIIDIVCDSNLKVLFKRKPEIGDILLPSQEQVNQTIKRLQKKGWFEYIFKGNGYKKLPLRLRKIFIESRLRNDHGVEILNDILINYKSNKPS